VNKHFCPYIYRVIFIQLIKIAAFAHYCELRVGKKPWLMIAAAQLIYLEQFRHNDVWPGRFSAPSSSPVLAPWPFWSQQTPLRCHSHRTRKPVSIYIYLTFGFTNVCLVYIYSQINGPRNPKFSQPDPSLGFCAFFWQRRGVAVSENLRSRSASVEWVK
jgi:hypothetical protein